MQNIVPGLKGHPAELIFAEGANCSVLLHDVLTITVKKQYFEAKSLVFQRFLIMCTRTKIK